MLFTGLMLIVDPLQVMAFAADKGLKHTMKIWLTDPFSTVHHSFNWFDSLLLFPYFLVMFVLAAYGIHRYTMCYHYFKFRKRHNPEPPGRFEELPRVTVQLPIFNEQFVIDRLIEAVCAHGVSARQARDPGAGRLHRRDHGGGIRDRGALCARWATRSCTSTARTGMAIRPGRWMRG